LTIFKLQIIERVVLAYHFFISMAVSLYFISLFLARWISDDPMFFRAPVDLYDELAKEEVRTVRNSHDGFL